MIKINLLHSAVENTNLDVVENAISNKGTLQAVLFGCATLMCVGAMLLDWYVTNRDNSQSKSEMAAEQATADRLQPITKQAKDLQDKNKAVEERINAIMRLRADQTGPLRLLQLVDGKLPDDGSFRLISLRQEAPPADNKAADSKAAAAATKEKKEEKKGDSFSITGFSPNENQVVAFAKNMEFADGWFSKFTITTNRIQNPEDKEIMPASGKSIVKSNKPAAPKEAIQFTIKCTYNPQNLLVNQTTAANQTGQSAPNGQPPAAAPKPPTP